MVLDWINRKFLERFLDYDNQITLEQECNNKCGINRKSGIFLNQPPITGHRYRYYIPEVNLKTNQNNHSTLNDLPKSSNLHNKSPVNKSFCKKNNHEQSNSRPYNRIKLLLILPINGKMIDSRDQYFKSNIIKKIDPKDCPFIVIPLPDPKSTLSNTDGCLEPKTDLVNEDFGLPIGDYFDANDEQTEPPYDDNFITEDYYMDSPFMQYRHSLSDQKIEKNKKDTLRHHANWFGDRKQNKSEQDDEWGLNSLDDSWGGDITFQIPRTNEYFRNKLKESPENNFNCSRYFMSVLRKFLFKANMDEESNRNKR